MSRLIRLVLMFGMKSWKQNEKQYQGSDRRVERLTDEDEERQGSGQESGLGSGQESGQ